MPKLAGPLADASRPSANCIRQLLSTNGRDPRALVFCSFRMRMRTLVRSPKAHFQREYPDRHGRRPGGWQAISSPEPSRLSDGATEPGYREPRLGLPLHPEVDQRVQHDPHERRRLCKPGDVFFTATTGPVVTQITDYQSPYSHQREIATPGYYQVRLLQWDDQRRTDCHRSHRRGALHFSGGQRRKHSCAHQPYTQPDRCGVDPRRGRSTASRATSRTSLLQ